MGKTQVGTQLGRKVGDADDPRKTWEEGSLLSISLPPSFPSSEGWDLLLSPQTRGVIGNQAPTLPLLPSSPQLLAKLRPFPVLPRALIFKAQTH